MTPGEQRLLRELRDRDRRLELANGKVAALEATNESLRRQNADLKKRPTRAEHEKLQADYYGLLEWNQKLQRDRVYG